MANKTLHLWLPDIFEFKGGIQVYSAFLLEALQKIIPDYNYEVFLKHDTGYKPEFSFLSNTKYHFAGHYPLRIRTTAFAVQLIAQGLWQCPRLIIATHVNFAVAAYWLKLCLGIPYWVVAHGLEAWNIENQAMKMALSQADKIIAVSNYTRDRILVEQNLQPQQVDLLPNTFCADYFEIASKPPQLLQRYGLDAQQPIILTVARLDSCDRYKGYDRILEALPHIRTHLPKVHYILVGKGSDRPRIEKIIAQLQLSDCVTLTGFVPDEELAAHYNLCDVFAMPSKAEGFGIVYLEALACGKATLGGNQDGAIDALCHGELGALVDPDDVTEIGSTLLQILQGQYANSLIYQPERLRQKVIDVFGFASFQNTLTNLLAHAVI